MILAIGNYMNNSARRGGAFGFKLSALENLHMLKSAQDKSMTLMNVLANMISTQSPELLDFTQELALVDKATTSYFF